MWGRCGCPDARGVVGDLGGTGSVEQVVVVGAWLWVQWSVLFW